MIDEPRAILQLQQPLYHTTLREVRVYEDLVSTSHDLTYAREYLTESIGLHGSGITPVTKALFSAAHMSYRRCFNRKTAGIVKSDLRQLSAEQTKVHQYHIDQADKLVAHSVNGFEIVKGGLCYNGNEVGVGIVTARFVGLDKPDAEKWLSLMEYIAANILAPKVNEALNAAIVRAKKIPFEDVIRAQVIQGAAPTRDGAGKRRS